LALAVLLGLPPALAVNPAHTDIVSANPSDNTPHIADGQVNAIVQIGDTVVVGGTFTQVREANRSTFYPRNYLFAFEASTGRIRQDWVPALDGPVEALVAAPDGRSVFVGGHFNTVNGVTRRKVVLLDLATGAVVTPFRANADARVLDLALQGNRLYVAGAFTAIGGVPVQALAAVDPSTGAVDTSFSFTFSDPRVNTPRVMKIDVTPDGRRLVAIGNFRRVNGLDRSQIVMLDLSTSPASVADWQTSDFPQTVGDTTTSWCAGVFDSYMRDVDFSPDGSYFVVVTTGAYRANRLCDTASRWETWAVGSNLHPTWVDWSGGDTSTAVAVTGVAVYVGGHQRWWNNPYAGDRAGPGAVSRDGIAALDPVNGLPLTWDPRRDPRGVGVFAFHATDQGLWVGSDTNNIGGEFHGKIAFMPLYGGTTPPRSVPYGLPNDLYNLEAGTGNMVRRSYDGSVFGSRGTVPTGVDWRQARGVFALNGVLYMGWSDGWFYARTFDGVNLGPAVQVNLNGLEIQPPSQFRIPGTNTRVPAFTTQLQSCTGMFFDDGRIYYTVQGDPRLYYRYFTEESRVVGANLFVASASGPVDWRNVRGMTMANDVLYYALSDGTLNRIAWVNGAPSGSPTVIGGPAIDGYNWASQGLFAFPQVTDTLAPSRPGKPTGTSNSTDSIDLTWAASTDNRSTTITYRVYRDGDPTPIASVTSSSTTTVSFTDTGLEPGSTHTYTVDAVDEASNASAMSQVSDPITTLPVLFADAFDTGDLSAWTTVVGLTIDHTNGATSPPSAVGSVSGAAAYAGRDLGGTATDVCVSVAVNVASRGSNAVDLVRLRTINGTTNGGPLAKVFLGQDGRLYVRNDHGSAQISSGTLLPSGWNTIELCGRGIGPSGSWDLYLNGTRIVSGWATDTGPDPAGRVQIGDTAAKTWTINFDDVVVDTVPG
jgi:hypothetical protein